VNCDAAALGLWLEVQKQDLAREATIEVEACQTVAFCTTSKFLHVRFVDLPNFFGVLQRIAMRTGVRMLLAAGIRDDFYETAMVTIVVRGLEQRVRS
jgi:hypothetical protein